MAFCCISCIFNKDKDRGTTSVTIIIVLANLLLHNSSIFKGISAEAIPEKMTASTLKY